MEKEDLVKTPVEVSARHIHLSQEDLEKLFGKGHNLKIKQRLSQPGEFAAKETVNIINPENKNKVIKNVRVLGPIRKKTQVEVSKTDAVFLGIEKEVPIRLSGNTKNTPGIKIEGPKEKIKLKRGVIIPKRHLHISEEKAEKIGIKENQKISLKISGKRGGILENIIIRISPNYKLSVHLDTDEGNALGINKKTYGSLINSNKLVKKEKNEN